MNHLNAFGGDGTLPTYPDDSLVKDGSNASQRAMVQFLHRHGAVVALNHPATGPPGSDQLARKLVTTRGNGCDLVEVGRDNIEERLPAYDVTARNAIFLTATGVTDDHDGVDWLDALESAG